MRSLNELNCSNIIYDANEYEELLHQLEELNLESKVRQEMPEPTLEGIPGCEAKVGDILKPQQHWSWVQSLVLSPGDPRCKNCVGWITTQ